MFSTALLFAVLVGATPADPAAGDAIPAFVPPARTEAEVADQITGAARAFVATLPQADLAGASFAYAGPEQRYWHWIPAPLLTDRTLGRDYAPYGRIGLPLEKMGVASIAALHRLFQVTLSANGYRKLEQVLRREGGDEPRLGFVGLGRTPGGRPPGGPGWYFFSLFGTVGDGTWGFRFEGHHISLNIAIAGGHVLTSPLAIGHNPSPVVPEASTLAVRLFDALTPEQQRAAHLVVEPDGKGIPGDMDRTAGTPAPVGAALGALSPEALALYDGLTEDLVGSFPEPVAAPLRAKVHAQAAAAHLAWYGAVDDVHPHYYRLQGPSFLMQVRHQGIERGHAHVHTSWRTLDDGSVANGVAAP